ncbi:MAG: PIN domain-containing protein [Candidatus Diapherotrites archaeon]|nr:PIN domain-containing protein [Candidatus Diapherotrites archaeon]
MKYFFDTYALVKVAEKDPAYAGFLAEEIVTSVLNLAEFYYVLLRRFDKRTADYWLKLLAPTAWPVSLGTLISAMEFRFHHRKLNLSYIDCRGYLMARDLNLVFLTGDRAFKGMDHVEWVA